MNTLPTILNLKKCSRCKIEKSLDKFVADKRLPSGRRGYCRDCRNLNFRNRYKEDDALRKRVGDSQKLHKNLYGSNHIERTFGLDAEDFQEMMEDQDGRCLICERLFHDNLPPNVDHDHSCCPSKRTCGKCVRGLVCLPCNIRLATVEDSKWMKKAEWYLEIYR